MRERLPRFALDARALNVSEVTGTERYIVNLVRELLLIEKRPEMCLYFLDSAPSDFTAGFPGTRVRMSKGPAWLQLRVPLWLLQDKVRVAHFPYGILPRVCPCPTIITMYDLSWELSPESYPEEIVAALRRFTRASSARADHILCISEATRQDLTRLYRVPVNRTSCVHLGVEDRFHPAENATTRVRELFGLSNPYVLFVGTIQPRKNLPRLIRSFTEIKRSEGLPHELAIAGTSGWKTEETFEAIAASGIAGSIRILGHVKDEDLPLLYSGADCVAFPSLEEGFGLPVLEAMACGTPVVTSNVRALVEVAGEAAVSVPATEPVQLAEALKQVLLDKTLRERLREAGLVRARQFTWQKTAEKTLEVYRKVAAEQ